MNPREQKGASPCPLHAYYHSHKRQRQSGTAAQEKKRVTSCRDSRRERASGLEEREERHRDGLYKAQAPAERWRRAVHILHAEELLRRNRLREVARAPLRCARRPYPSGDGRRRPAQAGTRCRRLTLLKTLYEASAWRSSALFMPLSDASDVDMNG